MSPRARCPVHDVALSPEGACLLCRRSEAPRAPERPGFRALAVPGAVMITMIVVASVLVVRMLRTPPPSAPIAPVASTAAPSERAAPPPEDPARGARSEPPRFEGPDPYLLAAARRRVSITMYGTSWCGYCGRARAWLRDRHVAYVERDIERDADAAARMRQLNPRGSVPTFEIDGEVMVGFSPEGLEATIDHAAARYL